MKMHRLKPRRHCWTRIRVHSTAPPMALPQQRFIEPWNRRPYPRPGAPIDPSPSPPMLSYAPDHEIPITRKLHLVRPHEDTPSGLWPAFRMLVSTVLSCVMAPRVRTP